MAAPAAEAVPQPKPAQFGGSLDPQLFMDVGSGICTSNYCGVNHTAFEREECILNTVAERFWNLRHFNPVTSQVTMAWPGTLELPPHDHPVLVSICKWARDQLPEELSEIGNNHKRFILYYFFAVEVFGARTRICLPHCVVTAIRYKYPNPVGIPYVGHRD